MCTCPAERTMQEKTFPQFVWILGHCTAVVNVQKAGYKVQAVQLMDKAHIGFR